jgi:hypothetical protein
LVGESLGLRCFYGQLGEAALIWRKRLGHKNIQHHGPVPDRFKDFWR